MWKVDLREEIVEEESGEGAGWQVMILYIFLLTGRLGLPEAAHRLERYPSLSNIPFLFILEEQIG
jgi:hypothetical protein